MMDSIWDDGVRLPRFSPLDKDLHVDALVVGGGLAGLLRNGVEATVNLLRPTAPRCPHLGCALHWNKEERSWDCSCHGSRFDGNGKVLDNPATDDMKRPPGGVE